MSRPEEIIEVIFLKKNVFRAKCLAKLLLTSAKPKILRKKKGSSICLSFNSYQCYFTLGSDCGTSLAKLFLNLMKPEVC